jgi:hypothetical protein
VLLPCICILQPKLVHLYQTSSLARGFLVLFHIGIWSLATI